MSRKKLHVIALNSLAHRMRNMKICLDAQQIKRMRLVFQNDKLVLSATTLDAQIAELVSNNSPPSTIRCSNIEKLSDILKSDRRNAHTHNTQIQGLEADYTKMCADLHTTRGKLEETKNAASESFKTIRKLNSHLEDAVSAKHEIEESLRSTKNELRQAQQALQDSRIREEELHSDARKSHKQGEDADARVRVIENDLRTAQRTVLESK